MSWKDGKPEIDNSKQAERELVNSLRGHLREIEFSLYADHQIGRETDPLLTQEKSKIVGRLRKMGYRPDAIEQLCAEFRRECERVHREKDKEIPVKSAVGRNIETLRKECGWSFDQLAENTGMEKKLILRHVNKGTRPTPRILREYAQAFTKRLGRNITVCDLEKQPRKAL